MVVIDLTWETMASNVSSQPASATTKLNAMVKIHKYRELHEGHHFISMAIEVHRARGRDMDHFIRECAHLFHNR